MASKVDVKVENKKTETITFSEIPNGAAFFGTIGSLSGLFFKNHIALVCLNPDKTLVGSGGVSWSSDFIERWPTKVVEDYMPVDLQITAIPKY